jgi:hypothetical protein
MDPILSTVLRMSPAFVGSATKNIKSPLLRRSLRAASLGGAGYAELSDQEQIRFDDLIQGGLTEEQALAKIKATPLVTGLRTVPAAIGDALNLTGFLPLELLGAGIKTVGGTAQGYISGVERGYAPTQIATESLLGGAGGALEGGLDAALGYVPVSMFTKYFKNARKGV